MQPNCYCDDCVATRDWFRDNATQAEKVWTRNVLPTEAYRLGWMKPSYPVPAPINPHYNAHSHSFGWLYSPANGRMFEFVWYKETDEIVTFIE